MTASTAAAAAKLKAAQNKPAAKSAATPAPAPAPEAAAPAPDAATTTVDAPASTEPAAAGDGTEGGKRSYKTREETAAFWQAKIDKVQKDADEKIARYKGFLEEATRPRQRAHVKDEALNEVLAKVESGEMSEDYIRQQRALFDAAMRRMAAKKETEGGEAAPAAEGTETTPPAVEAPAPDAAPAVEAPAA